MPTETPQRFYLLKVADKTGHYYVVCQALVEVDERALPGAVKSAVDEEFKKAARGIRAEVCEISNPSEDRARGWTPLHAMIQLQLRPGPMPGPGGG